MFKNVMFENVINDCLKATISFTPNGIIIGYWLHFNSLKYILYFYVVCFHCCGMMVRKTNTH